MVTISQCGGKKKKASGKPNLNNAYPVHSGSKFNEMIPGSNSVIIVASSIKTSISCSAMMKKNFFRTRIKN